MKTTISKDEFKRAFKRMGRETQFSQYGLEALFDHFEQIEDECGIEIELDVIAICCDYTEATADEFREMYNIDEDEDVQQYLEDNSPMVLTLGDDEFIIQQF
jgi:hypothetical protein